MAESLRNMYECAIKLIKSYFSNYTQCVLNDNVLSEFDNIIYGSPQGSVLGPCIFYLYLMPLHAMWMFHKIGHYVYGEAAWCQHVCC